MSSDCLASRSNGALQSQFSGRCARKAALFPLRRSTVLRATGASWRAGPTMLPWIEPGLCSRSLPPVLRPQPPPSAGPAKRWPVGLGCSPLCVRPWEGSKRTPVGQRWLPVRRWRTFCRKFCVFSHPPHTRSSGDSAGPREWRAGCCGPERPHLPHRRRSRHAAAR